MDISENLDVVKDSGTDVAIKVGSMVEVDLASGPAFATVRWIGSLPNMPCRMAGLELVLVNTDLYWLPFGKCPCLIPLFVLCVTICIYYHGIEKVGKNTITSNI